MKKLVYFLSIIILTSLTSPLEAGLFDFNKGTPKLRNYMNVQWPKGRDNFFEGWYHRLVDRKNKTSVIVITTAYNTKGITKPGIKNGYVSIIIKQDGQAPILRQRKFDEVYLSKSSDLGYELRIPNIGHVNNREFDILIDEIHLTSTWSKEERLPWPATRVSGIDTPAGMAARFKVFPTHWHVNDMGGDAHYRINSLKHGLAIQSTAIFHHEKNWGNVFPHYWYWLDVMDHDQKVYVSGAGGKIKILGVDIPAFLLAIRTPVGVIRVSPLNKRSRYKIESNNCTQFKISGSDRKLAFELSLSDESPNFFNLLIPTDKGYVPGALESVTAKAKLKIWKKTILGKKTLLATYFVDQSALEFGNEAYKCK
jgi:hypothetical protein